MDVLCFWIYVSVHYRGQDNASNADFRSVACSIHRYFRFIHFNDYKRVDWIVFNLVFLIKLKVK